MTTQKQHFGVREVNARSGFQVCASSEAEAIAFMRREFGLKVEVLGSHSCTGSGCYGCGGSGRKPGKAAA